MNFSCLSLCLLSIWMVVYKSRPISSSFFRENKNTPLIWRKNVLNVLNFLPKLVNNSSMEITEICFGFNSRSDGNAQDKLNRFRICWQSLFTQNCQNSNVSGLTKIFWWQSKEPLMLEDSVFENVAESLNHLYHCATAAFL